MSRIANSIIAPNEMVGMGLENVRRLAKGRLAPGSSYAGNVTPDEAWDILAADAKAVLVDVRTDAEWNFVGIADLRALDKKPIFISWQNYPGMAKNEEFLADLSDAGVTPDAPVLFLCRSGARSASAAQHCTAAGFNECFNILEGFEGDADGSKHRGQISGWKKHALPWVQG
jgi:rhodanese-related sulfurtransferase